MTFIEITFIIVPVVAPIFAHLGVDLLWVGILIAMNLQTSFLTPPFGFSLFYLKGVAPPEVRTGQIYRGIIPFIIVQLIGLTLVIALSGSGHVAAPIPGVVIENKKTGTRLSRIPVWHDCRVQIF